MIADHEPLPEIEEGQHRIFEVENKLLKKAKSFKSADFDYTQIDKSLAYIVKNYPEVARPRILEMRTLWTAIKSGHGSDDVIERIGQIVHDFKGEGSSFGFPIVSSVAETLCLLCTRGQISTAALQNIVEAHVAAIEAVLTNEIRGDGGLAGEAIVQMLRDSLSQGKKNIAAPS